MFQANCSVLPSKKKNERRKQCITVNLLQYTSNMYKTYSIYIYILLPNLPSATTSLKWSLSSIPLTGHGRWFRRFAENLRLSRYIGYNLCTVFVLAPAVPFTNKFLQCHSWTRLFYNRRRQIWCTLMKSLLLAFYNAVSRPTIAGDRFMGAV